MLKRTLLRPLVVTSVSLGLIVAPSVAALAVDTPPASDDKAAAAAPADPKDDSKADPKAEPKDDAKAEPKDDAKAEPKAEPKADPKDEAKADPKDEPKDDAKADPKDDAKADPKDYAKADPKADPKDDAKADPKDPKISKDDADKLKKDKDKTDGKLAVKAISVATGIGAVDTAFVIDTTSSMEDDIDKAIALAKKNGSKVHRLGGRTAIVEFRDGGCDRSTAVRVVLDFGTDAKKFNEALSSLTTGPDSCDPPESMLAGIRTALEKLSWKKDGGRAIVVMTDAGFHDPDYDGTTLADITNAVSEDGKTIRVYPLISDTDNVKFWDPISYDGFKDLADITGGDIVSGDDSLSKAIDKITTLPVVSIPLPEYTVMPASPVAIDLSHSFVPSSAKKVTYEINCNGDGKTWVKVSDPSAAMCTFDKVGTYTVNARMTLDSGVKSLDSTKVVVTDKPVEVKPVVPVTKLAAEKPAKTSATRGSVSIKWEAADDPYIWFITVNGRPVGTVDGTLRELKLEDIVLGTDAEISVTAISSAGEFGEPEMVKVVMPEPSSLADPKVDPKADKKAKDAKKAGKKCAKGKCAKAAHMKAAGLATTGSTASVVAVVAVVIAAAGIGVVALRRRTTH